MFIASLGFFDRLENLAAAVDHHTNQIVDRVVIGLVCVPIVIQKRHDIRH